MNDKLIIIRDLKRHLQNGLNFSIKNIILFGSQVYGQPSDFSDYDVLIVLDTDYGPREENVVYDLCYDIDLKYDIIIDAHIISHNELNSIKGKQPIFANAINTGLYA
jgi:predicted nucleotidyltransferase